MDDKFYQSEIPKKPSTFHESIDKGVKRLIEVNKTYRYPKEGGGTDLYRVKSIGKDTLVVENMKTKKTKTMDRSNFQSKLNSGKIYVSATLITALKRILAGDSRLHKDDKNKYELSIFEKDEDVLHDL